MIQAVVFDLGGVVLDSPMDVIAGTEALAGLEPGTLNRIASNPDGAWALHETGAVTRAEFIDRFEQECRQHGGVIDVATLLDTVESCAQARPRMIRAIGRLREAEYKVAALTNNWESPDAGWDVAGFQEHFDVFVESWVEGVRKPDPGIYLRLLDRLDVPADACVFLDDIGRNLSTARRLGMETIKVVEVEQALADLGELVGIEGL